MTEEYKKGMLSVGKDLDEAKERLRNYPNKEDDFYRGLKCQLERSIKIRKEIEIKTIKENDFMAFLNNRLKNIGFEYYSGGITSFVSNILYKNNKNQYIYFCVEETRDGYKIKNISKASKNLEYFCNGQVVKGSLKGTKKERKIINELRGYNYEHRTNSIAS